MHAGDGLQNNVCNNDASLLLNPAILPSMWLALNFLYHQIKIPKAIMKWCLASGQNHKSIAIK